MRIGLGMSIVAVQGISPASAFVSRVIADGGTAVSPSHTQEAYNDAFPYGPSLLCTCDAGKATKLYNIIPT